MDFDTTELYLNLIQVHCLYRVLFTRSEIRKGQKQKKKTLDTTEVLAKSIYRYVIFLVNIYDDKQRCSVFCLKKTSFFIYISQHEVGEQCLNSCKNKSLITLQYWQHSMQWSYTDTVSCFRTASRGKKKRLSFSHV